tara:strand:+ start:363 stop:677 length:315 start_codon:yes stop_codon:yes gene_type:complete
MSVAAEKEKFLKSMIKVKISINSTMLKKYMIDENERYAECYKGEKKEYIKSIRGQGAKYFLDYKKELEIELSNECLDNIIDQLDMGVCSPYEEFSISDFTESIN